MKTSAAKDSFLNNVLNVVQPGQWSATGYIYMYSLLERQELTREMQDRVIEAIEERRPSAVDLGEIHQPLDHGRRGEHRQTHCSERHRSGDVFARIDDGHDEGQEDRRSAGHRFCGR